MTQKTGFMHANNFDCIRIFAALAVLYSHHFALTGRPEPYLFGVNTIGGDAVGIFFAVSGYLVTSSWYNDPNIFRFALRRILRIWPALIVVVLSTAYILGAALTTLDLSDYLSHPVTTKYLNWFWMKAEFALPGVMESNPYPSVLNGSLWTIPLEVQCYVVLAAAGFFGVLSKKTSFLTAIAIYLVWFFIKSSPDLHGTIHSARQLGAYFLVGAALYATRNFWEKRKWLIFSIIVAVGLVTFHNGFPHTGNLIILTVSSIFLGTANTPVISRFAKFGDPSYGIYLFAFPVQQTVIYYMLPEVNFYGSMLIATLITVFLAFTSWHLIEKQAIKFKPHRRNKS